MLRKTTALLSLSVLFLAFGCGGRTNGHAKNQKGPQDQVGNIENRTGTAKGSDYSGTFEVTVNYSNTVCEGFKAEEKAELDGLMKNVPAGSMTCTQKDGKFVCGEILNGYLDADSSFGIAIKGDEALEDGGKFVFTYSMVGKFVSQDEANGQVTFFGSNALAQKKRHCTARGMFKMVRVEPGAKAEQEGLLLSYQSDDNSDTRSYRKLVTKTVDGNVQVQAKGTDTTVIILSKTGVSVERSPFGPFSEDECVEEQFESDAFDLSFTCSNDLGDLEGDLLILPTDDTGAENL